MTRSSVLNAGMNVDPLGAAHICRVIGTIVYAVLWIGALLLLFGLQQPAFGQVAGAVGAAVKKEFPTGLFFGVGRDDGAIEAPILASDVTMTVNGLVARVTVRQHFLNPSNGWLEGIYIFPLPERSAVDRLVMTVGGQRIEGKIMAKEEAVAAYNRAASAGQRASLLTSERPNIFATSVANIGPGEKIMVEIEYQDQVAYEDGRFSLRFPMVVAPRYTPPSINKVADADALPEGVYPVSQAPLEQRDNFGPMRTPDEGFGNPMTLAVTLDAGMQLARLESLYHPVRIEPVDERRNLVTLTDGSVPAARDFVLEWEPVAGSGPEATVFAEALDGDSHLLVLLVPPTGEVPKAALPRDLIFMVDTSGSMHGASIDQAKMAVLHAIERLEPVDRFNVIRFSDHPQALFDTSRFADKQALRDAVTFIFQMEANGGTEMLPALRVALDEPAVDGRLRQLVFLTDGAVSNEAEIFELIAQRIGGTRIFSVGIGSAPNSHFMRETAALGRGSFSYIGDTSEVAERMAALTRKLERPVLTDLEITWPDGASESVEAYPNLAPDLYAGEPIVMTALLRGQALAEIGGEVTVRGRIGDSPWERKLPLLGSQAAPGVAALWARAKIAQIRREAIGDPDARRERQAVLDVALQYALVTQYTSLVAIDERSARPVTEALDSVEIARNLPTDWGGIEPRLQALPPDLLHKANGSSSAISLPQTATPAERMLLTGLALVVLSGLLLLGRRRYGFA